MQQETVARSDGPTIESLDQLIWVGDIPSIGAAQCPDRAAIIFADRGRQISYADLDRQSGAYAASLTKNGLVAGDRVAYLGRNNDAYMPVLFGSIRAQSVLVPLNWRLTAQELGFQISDSQAKFVFCDPDFIDTARQAVATLPHPPRLVPTEAVVGDGESLRDWLHVAPNQKKLKRTGDEVVLQLYTSGTTGRPKGVLVSHRALTLSRHGELSSPDFDHLGRGIVSLSAMPNFHIGGMSWMLMSLIRLGTVVLTADPSPANMLKLLREYQAEYSFIVPTVIRSIVDSLRAGGEPAPTMKGIFYGAMPMSESLLRESMELFGHCAFLQFFGMTEIAGSATYLAPRYHDPSQPTLLKSVGKPYPGMSLEIRGPDRQPLRHGEHGEVWIRSPTLMSGYWNLPEKTAEAVVDSWYASGDGGYLDENGFLYLTDRIKDMIVSGGENIYPIEVEEALRQHPAVLDAAVVGVPDAHWGERVAAVIELRPQNEVAEDELRGFVKQRLAGYKCPKTYRFVAALPRTSSGKVKRVDLRNELASNAVVG